MKKTSFLGLAVALLAFCMPQIQAQEAQLPFTGNIQYKITYQSDVLPAEHLAQMPVSASIKMSADKMVFEQADGNKAIVDASTGEIHTLANLSMMGLGKYHIVQNVADVAADTAEVSAQALTATGQSKDIHGYKAFEYTSSITSDQGNVEMTLWCVPGFCSPVFNWATQVAIGQLNGFPLEYSLKTAAYTMTVSVSKMSYGEVDAKHFEIHKSYKPSTKEEMSKDIEEMMKAFGM